LRAGAGSRRAGQISGVVASKHLVDGRQALRRADQALWIGWGLGSIAGGAQDREIRINPLAAPSIGADAAHDAGKQDHKRNPCRPLKLCTGESQVRR
jgi:hypothetical protein